jgi:Ferredoxin subunits of nitrite reductase and ring-hydroxylating dioxygenases
MSDWVDVIAETALAEGENIVVDVDGTDIALFKIQGSFYAIEDICSHDGAEIASGFTGW